MDKHVPVNRLWACLSVLTLVFALWYVWRMGKFARFLGVFIGGSLVIGFIGALVGTVFGFPVDDVVSAEYELFIQVSSGIMTLLFVVIMYRWATEYNKKHWGYPDHSRATYKMNRIRDDTEPEDL